MKTSEQTLVVSSRKRRIAAYLIDHFVLCFLMVGIVLLILGPDLSQQRDAGIMTSVLLPAVFCLLIYFAKDSIKGMSLGKWMLEIMVRDDKDPERVPSFGRLLLRNVFMLIWPVEFIVLAASDKKRRLGDQVAGTSVYRNPVPPARLPRVLTLAGLGACFFVFTFLFSFNAMKSSGAYKAAIREIEMNKEIQAETGGITGYGSMVSGSINTSNGHGEARLTVTVLGREKDMTVVVYLTKEPGYDWQQVEMEK